jgi:hypothetical protein
MFDQVNRTVLLVLGVVLCVAGVLGILANQGRVALLEPFEVYRQLEVAITAQPALWWAVIVVVGLLIAVLGGWYALRQVAVRAGRRLDTIVLRRDDLGVTRVEPSAASRAVTRDLDRVDHVSGARVRMRRYQPTPSLVVRLDLADQADLGQVRAGADEAFERLRRTLGADALDADVLVRLRPPPPAATARVE